MSEKISTLIGILLDFSSLKSNLGDDSDIQVTGGEWVHSVFQTIGDIIRKDVSETNKIFAIGFGKMFLGNFKIDIFKLLKMTQTEDINDLSSCFDFIRKGTEIDDSSIFSVKEACNILLRNVDETKIKEKHLNCLVSLTKFLICDQASLLFPLEMARELFSDRNYHNHQKLLLVISHGTPTNEENKKQCLSLLRDKDVVVVVSCFISSSRTVEPRRLFCRAENGWEVGAKFMFELSSKIPTQLLPRTIFLKQGWNIDIEENETKLFLQVNHPDNIQNVCELAHNIVCCKDALVDILASISMDIYINQSTTEFGAKEQRGSTCYANASAAVLHLSMKRILGREGGYPLFHDIRQKLIDFYGIEGANTLAVLQNVCPKYRLQCKRVDTEGAIRAITAKRPVAATFRLTDAEWNCFSKFYRENKTGVLSRNEIDLRKRPSGISTDGHAVVLTSLNNQYLYFMNSWGTGWGDNGFFRVKNASVLDFKFIDVFWTLNDLKESEKCFFKLHGSKVADELMNTLNGLREARYTCPLCHKESNLNDFSGHLSKVQCPKCKGTFSGEGEGNILALNMHLTALSR